MRCLDEAAQRTETQVFPRGAAEQKLVSKLREGALGSWVPGFQEVTVASCCGCLCGDMKGWQQVGFGITCSCEEALPRPGWTSSTAVMLLGRKGRTRKQAECPFPFYSPLPVSAQLGHGTGWRDRGEEQRRTSAWSPGHQRATCTDTKSTQ